MSKAFKFHNLWPPEVKTLPVVFSKKKINSELNFVQFAMQEFRI